MTTAAKRARKKANRRKGQQEKAARELTELTEELDLYERPESEKAAAQLALATAKKLRKKAAG